MAKKMKAPAQHSAGETQIKSYLDMIAPSVVKFNADHFIFGNTYRCAWALREYPTTTDEQAILRHLGEKDGVTLRIYTRQVPPAEEKKTSMHRNREPLLHCAVYIELTAPDFDALKLLQTDVLTELVRSKLNVDRLLLRQQQGFQSVSPVGYNAFGAQFERVLPASSVANLYPFNYSGPAGRGQDLGQHPDPR